MLPRIVWGKRRILSGYSCGMPLEVKNLQEKERQSQLRAKNQKGRTAKHEPQISTRVQFAEAGLAPEAKRNYSDHDAKQKHQCRDNQTRFQAYRSVDPFQRLIFRL